MAYVNNPAAAAFVPAAAAAAAAQQPPHGHAHGHAHHPAAAGHGAHHATSPTGHAQGAPGNQALALAGGGVHPGQPTGAHHGSAAAAGGAPTSSLALLNMSNLINQKDSRWLQLEVCREFQRNKCSRSDNECKFAHPTSNVEVQNGRVTACYDSIKVSLYSCLLTIDKVQQ